MERPESLPSLVHADWVHLVVGFRAFSDMGDSVTRGRKEDSYLRNTHCASEPFHDSQSECVLIEILSKTLPQRCIAIRVEDISLRTDLCVLEASKSSPGEDQSKVSSTAQYYRDGEQSDEPEHPPFVPLRTPF